MRTRGSMLGVSVLGAVVGIVSFVLLSAAPVNAHMTTNKTPEPVAKETKHRTMPGMGGMRMPDMNPARGRKLFVSKGCVACHSINGVGGHDATNLDAHTMEPMMNPFEFAAKMWRMAPYMITAQEEALGEQIDFTGDELADIIAFIHSDEMQHTFSEEDLTEEAKRMMHHEHGGPGAGAKAHGEEIGHGPEGHMHAHGDDEDGAEDGHGHGMMKKPAE